MQGREKERETIGLIPRHERLYWATLIVVGVVLTAFVVAYTRLAMSDLERDANESALVTPQFRAGARLLQDKSLEL